MSKSNVELVIRARNEASQALRSISSALQEVVGDQRELASQAGATESRLGELGRELTELGSNFKALRGVSQLATDLSRSEQALRKQTAAAQEAGNEYAQLAKTVSDAERPTKRMTNQLGASARRLDKAREKTAALQTHTAELREEYTRAAEGAGALGADQTRLANLTQRAAAEFAELQTRLRETRNLSKGALSGVTEGLETGDLTVVRDALEGVQRSVLEAGEAADLSQVDLRALRGEIDQLETAASSLGQLKELAQAFSVMRRESRDLLRTFTASKERTEELARAFNAAEAPSRELGEALGKSRAETSRLANDYEVMRERVGSLGNALRTAGVDVSRLGVATGKNRNEFAQFDSQIEKVSQTLAESRIELDRLGDAQQVQAREAQEAARLRAEAEQRALREAKEAAAFEEQRQANLQSNARREYESFWQGALASRDAQRANAQAAAEAGRVIEQTGGAVDEAALGYRNAAAQVERMADAHQAAEGRVAGLREEQGQAAARAEQTGTAYREAEANLSRLAGEIERARVPSAALVEEFEAAKAELDQLDRAFKASQKELKGFDQALGQAEGALSGIADEFAKARERASGLEGTFNEVSAAYDALAATLRDNRDDTEAVAAAQQRLDRALEGSANALQKNGAAAERAERRVTELSSRSERAGQNLRELGGAANRTGRDMDTLATRVKRAEVNLASFRDQGRTTLSLMQRMRGQVLALTSAYVGLYGVGAGIRGLVDANLELEATQSRLRVAVGDSNEAVGAELQFVEGVADDLKLQFRELSEAYGRYATAARISGATTEETRAVFLGLAKAARVNKLSGDQLTRAFRAVEQIFSQGKVQAEELREQLADAGLAGTVGILGDALGVTGEELDKMLENGEIGAKALIPFAQELEKRFGPGLAAAIETTSASIADMQNQIYDIQLLIGESGFLESFAAALDRIAEELEKPAIRQGMQELGAGMGQALVYAVQLLDNLDEITLALKLLATVLGVKWFAQFVAGTATAITNLKNLTKGAGLATRAVRIFYASLVGVGVLLAAWSIADWAAKEFPAFGKHWYAFREGIDRGLAEMKLAFQRAGVQITDNWGSMLQVLGNLMAQWIAKDLKILAKLFDGAEWLAGGEGMHFGDSIREAADRLSASSTDGLSAAAKQELLELEEAHNSTLLRIAQKWHEARADIGLVEPNLTPDNQEGQEPDVLTIEDILGEGYETEWRLGGEAAGKAAGEGLAEEMATELDRVRERLAELSAETLEERLALIRSEFDELVAYLVASGNEAGLASVNELVGLLEAQERANFQKEQQRGLEEEVNDLLEFRRDLMDRIEFLRSQGDAGAITAAGELEQQLAGVDTQLQAALDKALAFARALGDEATVVSLQRISDSLVEIQDQWANAEQLNQQFASGASDAFLTLGTEIGKAADGVQSWGDAFRNAGDAFRQFVADFLRRIADAILQAAILKAITGSVSGGDGGIGGAIVNGIGAMFHDGGIVGQGGQPRAISPAWFENARRYHEGGVAGLKPNEVPAILERGEEVLTRNDPRHATNGGGSNQQPVRIINTFDAAEMVGEGLSTPAGERVIMNFMSRNRQKIKSTLG